MPALSMRSASYNFTLEEIQALYENGLGVWEYENAVPLPKEWYATDEEYLAPWQREELEKQDPEFDVTLLFEQKKHVQ